jgi:aerobic carbon-monoxide dehydrogenase large subunit
VWEPPPGGGPYRVRAGMIEAEVAMSVVGSRVLRTEDLRLITTGGSYTDNVDDERLAGAAHVVFVRSPVAHGRIVSVEIGEAVAAPGVLAVLTAADLTELSPVAPLPMCPPSMGQPLLADGTVRFVGEPVVAVVAASRAQAADAAELVAVDYDVLPAVVDVVRAASDETLLFPAAGTNTACRFAPAEQDADLFADCEVVVRRRILNPRLAPAPMEVRGAAASWDGAAGRLVAWLPSQGAQLAKALLAGALGWPADQLQVITQDVGGGFGAKIFPDPEQVLTCWLARHLDRPVRWQETRSENLVAMTHGRGQVQDLTIGGTRDGEIRAYRLEILQDSGAYPKIGAVLTTQTRLMATGVYAIPRVETVAVSVVTNTTPTAAYRGAGRPEATAAIERAMDLYAAEIGMDPAQLRRRNLIAPFAGGHTTATGAAYDSGDYPAALDVALSAADYEGLRREQRKRRADRDPVALGIGIAVYVEVTGSGEGGQPPQENATVELHEDGTATVLTGTSPQGQGHATVWAQLVSEQTGIPVGDITVRHGDTDLIPVGGGTFGSRSLQLGGSAVSQATRELVELARQHAAEELEANPADLVVDTDRAALMIAGSPDVAVRFADLAARHRLNVETVFTSPGPTFPFGAHVAVVEVDTETGKVAPLRVFCVDDAGAVVNPMLAEGQRHGGIAQGIAQALYEQIAYDEDGNPLAVTLADYGFPAASDLPPYELLDMATLTDHNPLGAKGVGEAGTIGATPAFQNAVIDALAHLGVDHVDMPTTPYRIWAALQSAR